MFNLQVNAACINKMFNRATICSMKKMHAEMERMYAAAAAAGRLDQTAAQTSMAQLLNVAPQNVHNWEKRGPSKDALLDAQRAIGVNATWIQTGHGPMFVGGSSTAPATANDDTAHGDGPSGTPDPLFPRVDRSRFNRLTASQQQGIEDWVIDQIDRYCGPTTDKSRATKRAA